MARMKSTASLDEQIIKAQEKVAKAKEQYDSACVELKSLLAERDSRRQKLLLAALAKSNKSFEDVLRFLQSSDSD